VERARVLSGKADNPKLEELLNDVSTDLAETLGELRELARGVHPALLTDQGLGPAIDSIARRAQIPTRVVSMPKERLPPPVEAAGYFLVSEGLTNAARHSSAKEVVVRAEVRNGWLTIEVSDDGVGGAHMGAGTGLNGLEDRVVSLGGVLRLTSPVNGGTTVGARIPTTLEEQAWGQ
jgi:signal transduction histidine kinase